MTNIVYSTCAQDVCYTGFTKDGNNNQTIPTWKVLIKGGRGVAKFRTLVTPKGHANIVTDQELELLESCGHFQEHKKNGYIKVERNAVKKTMSKAVSDMNTNDKSQPKTPKDYDGKLGAQPVEVGKHMLHGGIK